MRNIAAILSASGREWRKVQGASDSELAKLIRALPFDPPSEYIELLRFSNGGEGELALEPLWFQLFDVEFALQLWHDPAFRVNYPNLFFFGSNGGLESIAFDITQLQPWHILMVDCIAGMKSARRISENIGSFIQSLGLRNEHGT